MIGVIDVRAVVDVTLRAATPIDAVLSGVLNLRAGSGRRCAITDSGARGVRDDTASARVVNAAADQQNIALVREHAGKVAVRSVYVVRIHARIIASRNAAAVLRAGIVISEFDVLDPQLNSLAVH